MRVCQVWYDERRRLKRGYPYFATLEYEGDAPSTIMPANASRMHSGTPRMTLLPNVANAGIQSCSIAADSLIDVRVPPAARKECIHRRGFAASAAFAPVVRRNSLV